MTDILEQCRDLAEIGFADGEVIIAEGTPEARLFLLIEGEVSITKGDTEVARISDPGAVFGEISSLLGIPASASVTARSAVRARVAEAGESFIAGHPAVAMHTARILARRLYDATSYLGDLKIQFQDQSDHFGMMDRILESLVQQQKAARSGARVSPEDPRL